MYPCAETEEEEFVFVFVTRWAGNCGGGGGGHFTLWINIKINLEFYISSNKNWLKEKSDFI